MADRDPLTRRVLVVGTPYDVAGETAREVRAAALHAHGILNYKDEAAIDGSWEVRDSAGMLLDPAQGILHGVPLFVHRKAGWGG